jgi:outer membrane protein assembly factor BamB
MNALRCFGIAFFLCCCALSAQTPGTVLWTFRSNEDIDGSPALCPDGTIYIGSWDKKLYAIRPDGSKKWAFIASEGFTSSPAVDHDGVVYIGCMDHYIYAVMPDGIQKWRFATNGPVRSSPAIAADGTIYIGSEDNKLYAIKADGTLAWSFDCDHTGSSLTSSPAIGPDGTVYIGSGSNMMYALYPDGSLKWSFQAGDENTSTLGSSPAIGPDGTIYIGSSDHQLYAVHPDGSLKWKHQLDDWIYSGPTVGSDGTVYAATGWSSGQFLYAFHPDGTVKWVFTQIDGFTGSSPTIGQDGTVYIGSDDGKIFAVSSQGTELWHIQTQWSVYSSPVISPSGILYAGSSDNFLYAIQTGSPGLDQGGWPHFGKDAAGTKNAMNPSCPVARVAVTEIYTESGATIELDGTASNDPDNDAPLFEWTCIEKPEYSTAELTDADAALAHVRFNPNDTGIYKFNLRVSDGHDGESFAQVLVRCDMLWNFWCGYGPPSGTALGNDGSAYCVIVAANQLVSLNSDGSEKFRRPLQSGDPVKPVIGANGLIYVSDYMTLRAFNASGTEQWSYQAGSIIQTSPAVYPDGTIIIPTWDEIVALHPDGSIKWRHAKEATYTMNVTIAQDGTIYYDTGDNKRELHALDPDGRLKWSIPQGSYYQPAFGPDGTIYVNDEFTLWAVQPDGRVKWHISGETSEYRFNTAPVTGAGGTIYLGSRKETWQGLSDFCLMALHPEGSTDWKTILPASVNTYTLMATDSMIYFGGQDSTLYACRPDGQIAWTLPLEGALYQPFNLSTEGILFVPECNSAINSNNRIYAIHTSGAGLKDGVWPKLARDGHNSSCAYNPNCPVAVVAAEKIFLDLNQPLILDADASHDPDLDPLIFVWRCTSKPANSAVILADSTQRQTEVQLGSFGHYTFSVLVTDGHDGATCKIVEVDYVMKWHFGDKAAAMQCAAVAADSTVYIATRNYSIGDYKLQALSPDGSVKWIYTSSDLIHSPAIGADGTIYVSSGNELLAFNSRGSVLWRYKVPERILAPPALGMDGTIYVADGGNNLIAVWPDGSRRWTLPDIIQFKPNYSLSVGTNGILYLGSKDNQLLAVDPDGSITWRFSSTNPFSAAPAIDSSGVLYVADSAGRLYAINRYGTEKWRFEMGAECRSTPVIGKDNVIYVNSYGGTLYSVSTDGMPGWTFATGSTTSCCPAVGADGLIYTGTSDGTLYAIASDGTPAWSYDTGSAIYSSPALADDGTLYIGTSNIALLALKVSGEGLMASPWPKYGKDRYNSFGFGFRPNVPVIVLEQDSLYVAPGESITLDGRRSYDTDGDVLSFMWRCVEKPEFGNISIADSTAPVTTVRFDNNSIGRYRFSLLLSDDSDGSTAASVRIRCGLKWTFRSGSPIRSSPAITRDGSLIFTDEGGVMHALESDGSQKWSCPLNASGRSSPAVSDDGMVYQSSPWSGDIYAVGPDGSVSWWTIGGLTVQATPALASDGAIIIGHYDCLRAYNPDGSLKWLFPTGAAVTSSAVIDDNGCIYFGCDNTKVYALNPDGTKRWETTLGGIALSSPALAPNGTIYFGCLDQKLYALAPDGFLKWSCTTQGRIDSSPVIGEDGTVYIGSQDWNLYAIRPEDGTVRWSYNMEGNISATPLISEDNVIYCATGEYNNLYALTTDGVVNWHITLDSSVDGSLTIDDSGTLYCVTTSGRLYAIQTRSPGLARSGWPKFRKDLQNTGNQNYQPVAVVEREPVTLPAVFSLAPVFPNPFNAVATVQYSLPVASQVSITVLNTAGQVVVKLDQGKKAAGIHKFCWDAAGCASGVYFVRLQAGKQQQTQKCVLVR